MPLTEQEKRQIEEEERLRIEAAQPSWRDKLAETFNWMTQGTPANPLTWNTTGISSLVGTMNPMLALASRLPTMIQAGKGDPEAKEKLSSTARNNLNTLAAGLGGLTGGPTSALVNAGMANVLGNARDAGDVAETLVGSAAGGPLGKLALGASRIPNAQDVYSLSNALPNYGRQVLGALGLNAVGQGAASTIRGENPLGTRPVEVGTKAVSSLLLPAMAAGAQKYASTSPWVKTRAFFDALLGKGKVATFGPESAGEVIPQSRATATAVENEIDQAVEDYMTPRRNAALGGERALQTKIDTKQQELLQLGVQQAKLKEIQAQNNAVFGEARMLSGEPLREMDAARALAKFNLKVTKETSLKDLASNMNDVLEKGGAVDRDRVLAGLLEKSTKHPRITPDGVKVIYNPETGLHDIPFQTAADVDNVTKRIQKLGYEQLKGMRGKTTAQQTLNNARTGQPPPDAPVDATRELTPAERNWGDIRKLEDSIHEIDQKRAQLKGDVSGIGEETKAVNQSLGVARAQLERMTKEKVELIGELRTKLKALMTFNEENPILEGTVRDLTGKTITKGSPLGTPHSEAIGSTFIDPPADGAAFGERLTRVTHALDIIKNRLPNGDRLVKLYQDLVRAEIAKRTFATTPDGVLGGVEPELRGKLLSTLFGKDEGYRIAHNIKAMETTVAQGRKILGNISADRTKTEVANAAIRSFGYQAAHGNPIPLVTAAGVGISLMPLPFVKRILKDPVLGRQFQEWATEGHLVKANLRHYPVLSNAISQWPVTLFNTATGNTKQTTIGASE